MNTKEKLTTHRANAAPTRLRRLQRTGPPPGREDGSVTKDGMASRTARTQVRSHSVFVGRRSIFVLHVIAFVAVMRLEGGDVPNVLLTAAVSRTWVRSSRIHHASRRSDAGPEPQRLRWTTQHLCPHVIAFIAVMRLEGGDVPDVLLTAAASRTWVRSSIRRGSQMRKGIYWLVFIFNMMKHKHK